MISLDALREKELSLLDGPNYDYGLSEYTATDRFMELNHADMGEDSEEVTLRENRARKLLSERPLPSYQPF